MEPWVRVEGEDLPNLPFSQSPKRIGASSGPVTSRITSQNDTI